MAGLGASPRRAGDSDRERAELIAALYRNVPAVAFCLLFGAVVLCGGLIYLGAGRPDNLRIWFGLSLAVAAGQLALWAWRRRAGAAGDWRPWERRLVLACLIDGARWGLATLWLAAPGDADQQVWICMIVGGVACASVAAWGSYVRVYYAMLFPAMLPYVFWAATVPDVRYWGIALLGAIMTVAIAWLGRRQGQSFAEALRLRFENLDLAESLRAQKELAEQASLAKTRFLAAASHDLRQPMHALGMFVAALSRSRGLAPADSRLVGQIAETVEAMDGLFGSLLDISQLDAAMVAPEPAAFPVQPLLDRICREQAPALRGGAVALRQVPSGAVVRTDPILLERMLRNLIANAASHTASGRILVGCRREPGRLRIEVWDTGPGIAPEQQELVFEEYYQVGNPERDRARGLGLGLAITRRLSALLDCPISLRSRPGRGSVFAVSVPLASGEEARAPGAGEEAPQARRGLVFVVDDEALIQESTASLLDRWGYGVVAGGSAEEVLRRAGGEPPDLIICDWRLRGGETAPGAISSIRRACGSDAPAILITGDIAPDQLRAAHQTGLVLLHKPLAPAKLRAALGNLIAWREARGPQALRQNTTPL